MILIHDVRSDRCPNCGDTTKKLGVEAEWHAPGELVRHFICLGHFRSMLEGLLRVIEAHPEIAAAMRERMPRERYISDDTIQMIFAAAEKGAVDGVRTNCNVLLNELERGRR